MNGDTNVNYINSTTNNNENPSISQIIVTNGVDNYYRKAWIGHVTSAIQSTASWTCWISITGNAATASNVPWGWVTSKPTTIAWYGITDAATTTQLSLKSDIPIWWATSIMTGNLVANRVLVSDGSGKVWASTVTSTELWYLTWVTSNVQTQLNGKIWWTGANGYMWKFTWTSSIWNSLVYDNGTNIWIWTISPWQKLTVAWTIESTSGWIKFPDGTTQTTSANQQYLFKAQFWLDYFYVNGSYVLPFSQEVYDVGNMYNNANYTVTIPKKLILWILY